MSAISPQFIAFSDLASEAHHDPNNTDGTLSNSDVQAAYSELSGFSSQNKPARYCQLPWGTIDDRSAAMRRRLQKKVAARKVAKEQA